MKKLQLILFVFILLFVISCGTTNKIEALKPLPTTDNSVIVKNKTSFIAMPVEITLKEIQQQLNKNLKGLIYNDSIIKDDNIEMKVWKSNEITLEEKNGFIISKIPLKIWAKFKYGTDFLGLNDTKDLFLDGVVTLKSKPHLSNWKLTTNSTIEDFEWKTSPTIIVAGKAVPVTYIVNPALRFFKTKMAKEIDNAIDKTCDFKPQVLDALDNLSNPLLSQEAYEVWFKMEPQELYVTEAKLTKNKITMNMGLKCDMQTTVGEPSEKTFDKKKIVLKPVASMPDKFQISLAAVSTYESASKIITKNFQGQEFASGSRKVVVQKVALWQRNGKMIVALDLIGSINGTIYLTGIPNYNSITKEIYFEQMDYVVSTKSLLLKSANWLAQGTILKKIQENCRYSIQKNLEEGKANMLPYFQNYSPMKGVFVNGEIDDLVFDKVEITDKAIIAFITTSGKMNVKIDGLD
jgi:hypothetical protein